MSRDTQGKQRDILGNLGDIQVQPGDIAMSPKPLITTIKPSLKPEEEGDNIFVTYEHEIGPLTPNVRDQLIDLEDDHSAHWTCEAIKIASTNGKRNLGYIRAILNRWHADGYGSEYKPANGSTPAGNKSAVTRRLEALKNGKR
jgi:DnaD/phage-associated family protein